MNNGEHIRTIIFLEWESKRWYSKKFKKATCRSKDSTYIFNLRVLIKSYYNENVQNVFGIWHDPPVGHLSEVLVEMVSCRSDICRKFWLRCHVNVAQHDAFGPHHSHNCHHLLMPKTCWLIPMFLLSCPFLTSQCLANHEVFRPVWYSSGAPLGKRAHTRKGPFLSSSGWAAGESYDGGETSIPQFSFSGTQQDIALTVCFATSTEPSLKRQKRHIDNEASRTYEDRYMLLHIYPRSIMRLRGGSQHNYPILEPTINASTNWAWERDYEQSTLWDDSWLWKQCQSITTCYASWMRQGQSS